MAFEFKYFKIEQKVNAHKVGTDSMVLGAWAKGDFKNVLDIGTGTGILALMTAQNNPEAKITAIEQNLEACNEASINFKNSAFRHQITAVNSRLQAFETNELFDFIICNPPYFVGSTLSSNSDKNKARHTIDLTISDLYLHTNRLLTEGGQFSVVFPSDLLEYHLAFAKNEQLYPADILILTNESGEHIRHLITFSKIKTIPIENKMIVKYASGIYSKQYVELTKAFHNKDLPFQ